MKVIPRRESGWVVGHLVYLLSGRPRPKNLSTRKSSLCVSAMNCASQYFLLSKLFAEALPGYVGSATTPTDSHTHATVIVLFVSHHSSQFHCIHLSRDHMFLTRNSLFSLPPRLSSPITIYTVQPHTLQRPAYPYHSRLPPETLALSSSR